MATQYRTPAEARIALAQVADRSAFIDQTASGAYIIRTRCPYCGAAKQRGRCPVGKRDCGRP